MGGILPSLVAHNSAPKMQSSQDLFARPKRENGLHSLANITFDPIGNGAGPHSEKTYQDLCSIKSDIHSLGTDICSSHEGVNVRSKSSEGIVRLKKRYLRRAIAEYEYSFAPEYAKKRMSRRAVNEGTLDFDSNEADSSVEPSLDGAWVTARVWVPKRWLQVVPSRGG